MIPNGKKTRVKVKLKISWIVLFLPLIALTANAQEVRKPEGLLLRGFESEPLKNRRGFEAVENGVLTTVRVDAAEQISATRTPDEIKPYVKWYQQRAQKYLAYSVFDYATKPYLSDITNPELYVVDVDGNMTGDLNIHQADVFAAIVKSAKAYVDIGVDGIEYDVDGWAASLGSFDASSLSSFNQWLIESKGFSASELESIFGTTIDDSFDYGSYLRGLGVSTDQTSWSLVNQTSHYRLWRGFVNHQERLTTESLVEAVNLYSETVLQRKIEFYFNRYGFFHTPARRWNSIDVDSGSLGETWFDGVDWLYERGHTLEPLYRAGLKTFDRRYESWNSPPNQSEVVQSVFLASTLANNGVATWEDDYPGSAYIASFAYRFKDQLDKRPLSEVAIFYPHASVEHNQPIQANDEVLLGGQHYWYLGLGYLMAGLNLNYDVLYAGDGLVREDSFEAPSPEDYAVIFAAETRQVTDGQFAALSDYVFSGGNLIVIGNDVFRYDELGRDRSSVRNLGASDYDSSFGELGETSFGEGSVDVISLSQLASNAYSYHAGSTSIDISSIRDLITAALPDGVNKVELSGEDRLRALSYIDDADGSVILHLVNHGFNASGTSVANQTDVTVTMTLPHSVQSDPYASYVDASSGTVQSLPLTTNDNGSVSVNIPSIGVWGVLRIGSILQDRPASSITPMAELSLLFNYEEFSSNPDRDLSFQAADDEGLESVTFWYQKNDGSSAIWSDWTAGASMSLSGVKRVDADSTVNTIPVDFAELGEGRYRAQLLATDQDGLTSALVPDNAYDTIVGYDISAPDFSGASIEVVSGPDNNAAIQSPEAVTLAISGISDLISGVFQINTKFSNPSFDVAGEVGEAYVEGYTRTFSGPDEGQYGVYTISGRAQDNSQNWSEWVDLYTYTYGMPPSITQATGSHLNSAGENLAFEVGFEYSVSVGDSVSLEVLFSNVLDDETVRWYRGGELIEGQSERTLNLGSVSSQESGTYYAIVENAAGSTQSDSFEILVVTPLSITEFSRDPADGQVEQGGAFTLSALAEGMGTISYQWESQILRADWALLEGETKPNYVVTNATRAEHQGNYRVTVSDDNGSLTSERTLRIEVSQANSGGGGTDSDSDGDGVANAADNCPEVVNSQQNDMNGDGEGDACDDDIDGDGAFNDEEEAAGTDPQDPNSFPNDSGQDDRDGDGIQNEDDNCPDSSNSLQIDLDADGEGDACDADIDGDGFTNIEEGSAGTDPKDSSSFPVDGGDSDTDGDGVADASDNCPSVANGNQLDTDSDGLGNACDADDDNDGLYDDADAFPLDATEQVDSDDDGVGNNTDAFPFDATETFDIDGDGVGDNSDVFPFDASEAIDTDSDGIGNNADPDDDNDGYSDAEEIADGTNPLSRFSCRSGCFSFDIDESSSAKALSDGLLVIRHLFGFSGTSLVNGATEEGARTSAEEISIYLDEAFSELDIDGDGDSKPLTDGLLLIRYLFGFSGDALINGAVGLEATRNSAEEIEAYVSERVPSN